MIGQKMYSLYCHNDYDNNYYYYEYLQTKGQGDYGFFLYVCSCFSSLFAFSMEPIVHYSRMR